MHIFFKRRCILCFAGLNFHRNNLRALLEHKVQLIILIRVIARFQRKLSPQLLQNIILRQGAFKLILCFQQNRRIINPGHLLQQPGIKNKKLKTVQLIKSRQRMFQFGHIINPVQHPCRDQPFDGFFKITGPAAGFDGAVHKLFVRLGQLRHDAPEYLQDTAAVHLPVVLGKSMFIQGDQFFLQTRYPERIFVFNPGRHAFRHTANDQIIIIGIRQPFMENSFHALAFMNRSKITGQLNINCR